MQHKIKIFSDFDGTITLRDVWLDVGNYFIKDKKKWHDVIGQYERQEIGARDCYRAECELMEDFDFTKFNEIIDNVPLDAGFLDFAGFCKKEDIPFTILSEGMDYYIERILKNHALDFAHFANKFVYDAAGKKVLLDFPYSDSECRWCGCCKRNLLMNITGDDEIAVYIGDSYSDTCVSQYADIVFAKKSLASYCWKNNITYFEYQTFSDIRAKLDKILQKKVIKPRQNARVNRKNVFLQG